LYILCDCYGASDLLVTHGASTHVLYCIYSVNAIEKTVIAKRLIVQILNPNKMHETKKFSADSEKQSEKRKW